MALSRQQLRANHGRCGQDWNLSPSYVACISGGGNRRTAQGFSCSQLNKCSIGNLGDVNVSNATNGSVLVYGSSIGIWSVRNGCDIVASCDIDTLRNVNITRPLTGDVLSFNSTSNRWENSTPACLNCCFDSNIGLATDDIVMARVFYGCIVAWPNDTNVLYGEFSINGLAGQEGQCYITIDTFTSASNLWGIPTSSPCGNTVYIDDQSNYNFTLTGITSSPGMIATYTDPTPAYLYLAYFVDIGSPEGITTIIDSDFEGNVILYINGLPIQTRHISGAITNSNRHYNFAGTFLYKSLAQNDTVAIYWETTKDPQDLSTSLLELAYSGIAA